MTSLKDKFDELGGIVPAVGNHFDPLTEKDVKAIELRLKRKVPPSVREMLKTYGAFQFGEYVYYRPQRPFPKAYSKTNRGIVGTFLGKISPEFPKAKAIGLLHQLKLHGDDFADTFLPLADNGAGDLIGLCLGTGLVQLWVHDAPEGKDVYEISGSFEAWITSLEN